MSAGAIRFGPFSFSPKSGVLLRDDEPVAIGSKGAALLKALLSPAGEVRTKAELMDAAWPGLAVEESNLSVQIAALRKHLGETAGGGDWIVTLPRVGYRLAASPAPDMRAVDDTQAPRLAVLPFRNLGGDSEQDYFADGVVEDIITALSRFRSFAVIAGSSTFAYKGHATDARKAAGELGVRYVLEGSVRRSGASLRITAQLVEAEPGRSLWAQSFDGAADDVFAFQDKIAEAVATVIEPHIHKAEIARALGKRSGSLTGYDMVLRARARILTESEPDNREAVRLLDQVLAAEPDHALALSHAAWALEHRHTMGWPPIGPDDRRKCSAFARRGIELADGDATVIAHCASGLLQVDRDYDHATAVVDAAVEANPNNLVAVMVCGVAQLHCGDVEKAIRLFRRSAVLSPRDPLAHIPLVGIAHAHMILGDYEAALEWAGRSLAVNARFDPSYWVLISANALLGRSREAERYLAAYGDLSPLATVSRIKAGQPAKYEDRMMSILEGLRLAGMPED